ncbi:MAG: hypothetical protein EOM41_06245 [Bacilli bacterium]|jgi:FtsZ-interacting cell division protein ZipA|nr:hypothetical protein [Bacilli bacterium]
MVQIKKKVTLKAKTEQPAEPTQQNVQPSLHEKQSDISSRGSNEPAVSKNNGRKYLIGSIAVVALLCGGYYLLSDRTESSVENPTVQVTENSNSNKDNNNQAESANSDPENSENSSSDQAQESNPTNSEVSTEKENESVSLNEKQTSPKSNEVSSHDANSSISKTESSLPSGSLEQKAKEVIRGNYGNGIERKQKLGEQYTEIQGKVNEMYKKGLVD